jgi:PAS domain S-box-containing protein
VQDPSFVHTGWQYSPYSVVLGFSAVLGVAIAAVVWRRRTTPGAAPFTLLLLATAEWAGMAALEHAAVSPATKVFCAKLEYPGILSVAPLWLTFALAYTERNEWLAWRRLALLWVIPLVTLGLAWTSQWHRLVWTDITPSSDAPGAPLVYGHGAWFWLAASYSYVLNLLATVTLVRAIVRFPRQYRPQSTALVAGAVIPWIGNGIYLAGASPFRVDTTPLAFTLTGLVYAWGVFRLRLLDLVPVARHVLIESMADGVLVLDARNRLIDINPSARDMIGANHAPVVGESAEKVLAAWPDLVARYRDVSEAQAEVRIETTGGPRYLDLRISPLHDRHGHLRGRLIVFREVTARKRAEEQLRQALEELRATQARLLEGQTLRALGELASGAAHHLNNLLAIILGRTELLLLAGFGEGRGRLEAVRRATLDAAEVVRRVLRFAQRERLVETVGVNMSELAREVLELVRPRWQDESQLRGIAIEVSADLGEVPAVAGDPAALREVLVNLLLNAIDALPRGGRIMVRTWASGPWVCGAVSDTGAGMPEAVRARALEPFFTTKGVKSTGLGLSVAYGIVQQHGGDLTIESGGQGTTVTVRLPVPTPGPETFTS